MCGFKKFIVCLALLLAAALAVTLTQPLPALAVWGDNNEPMPVVLGLTLGGDIREHPELEPRGDGFPENWGKGATYEGIPVYPRYYNVFDYKISSVSFLIKVKDFPRFRKIMRRKFGNEIFHKPGVARTEGYHWGKYEVEIHAWDTTWKDMMQIKFSYLPLENQFHFKFENTPENLTYHGVTLGQKVEEYPFLHPIKEEAPDIVYYQSDEPPLVFDYDYDPTVYVESETWLAYKGVIYSLELRGDKADSHFMDRELKNIYKLGDYEARVIYSTSELRLDDYTIYFKGPGLTVTMHMPTYWNMLRAKARLGK